MFFQLSFIRFSFPLRRLYIILPLHWHRQIFFDILVFVGRRNRFVLISVLVWSGRHKWFITQKFAHFYVERRVTFINLNGSKACLSSLPPRQLDVNVNIVRIDMIQCICSCRFLVIRVIAIVLEVVFIA